MEPIACASLSANATGPKMTRAGSFYTSCYLFLLIILAAIYPRPHSKQQTRMLYQKFPCLSTKYKYSTFHTYMILKQCP